MLDRFFGLRSSGTNVRTEVLAGLTTFLTMAYIIFVNPQILSGQLTGQPTGLDYNAVLLATCVSAAIATLIMGVYANYPIALAPGMGENFFFVTVIASLATLGFSNAWQVALGIVFLSGVLFLILSMLGVREAIIDVLSPSLRHAIAVGIGLFIAFIGLRNGGLINAVPMTVGLNNKWPAVELAVFGFAFFVTAGLHARRVPGSIFWGIVAATLLAGWLGKMRMPATFVGFPEIKEPALFQMDVVAALAWECLPFIIIFLFMDLFDTVGTLIGVAEQAGLMRDNKLPRADRVLMSDAVGTVAGACLGTSTVTSFIESAAGVEQGGRTGLTAVTTAFLLLGALFFSPVVAMVSGFPPITAAALVIVGSMMMQNVRHIDWSDHSESIPAFLIILGIPFSYSIADGLALGFISYPIIKLLSGRAREARWLSYALSIVLLLYFIFVRARMG